MGLLFALAAATTASSVRSGNVSRYSPTICASTPNDFVQLYLYLDAMVTPYFYFWPPFEAHVLRAFPNSPKMSPGTSQIPLRMNSATKDAFRTNRLVPQREQASWQHLVHS